MYASSSRRSSRGGSRIPAHEPDVGAAAGRVVVLVRPEPEALVVRHVARGAGLQEHTGAGVAGQGEPSLHQRSADSVTLTDGLDPDRVQVPQRFIRTPRLDPAPEGVESPPPVLGQRVHPRFCLRLVEGLAVLGWDPDSDTSRVASL